MHFQPVFRHFPVWSLFFTLIVGPVGNDVDVEKQQIYQVKLVELCFLEH